MFSIFYSPLLALDAIFPLVKVLLDRSSFGWKLLAVEAQRDIDCVNVGQLHFSNWCVLLQSNATF